MFNNIYLFKNLARDQMWLNIPMDNHHFAYSTKLTPQNKIK
jgi:hypothetical protein